jgi:GPI mannosyltransferase 2
MVYPLYPKHLQPCPEAILVRLPPSSPQTAAHVTVASDIVSARSLTPQSRNTGFLRYWTLSNAPLFALAAPMLFVMSKSGKDLFFQGQMISRAHGSASGLASSRLILIVRSMVFAQLLLALMTFTSYHVQIITRLSSGYPAWYWWLAACLRSPKTRAMGSGLVVFMIMYASIQAVLFASFLPPA